MVADARAFLARFVIDGLEVRADAALCVADGRVTDIVDHDSLDPSLSRVDLGAVALVPGLVNAHSHAFQRVLRGRTEYMRADRPDEDFWSWRELMYRAALGLEPDELEAVSRLAFVEMALAGITTVGEFHYVHHRADGEPHADPNALAHRVIRAARDAGLRIGLLRVAYHRAGFDRSASPEQRRFVEPDVETFLSRADALADAWSGDDAVRIGLAPHSVRAVPRDWLETIAARADGRPIHIHACEQRAEIVDCVAAHRMPPVALLDETGLLDAGATLVHATHLTEDELDRLGQAKAYVCACPTTERNLGDGFLPARALFARGVPICLGSDSHADIDLWQEMRLVEYHERLQTERRNVLAAHASVRAGFRSTVEALWPMATVHGARSLGFDVGQLASGAPADFAALDLDHISLVGTDVRSLLATVAFGMTPGAVRDVFVGGEAIVRDRVHPRQAEAARALSRIAARLYAG